MTDNPRDLASQRVEHAMRHFQKSWEDRSRDLKTVSDTLDELDVAVEFWLALHEEDESEETG